MSTQITTAFVRQYGNAVQHLTQQKTSKLRPYVRVETVNGRSRFFDQLGSVAAAKRTSRHADTPRMDTPHARRRVTLDDYEYADLIDDQDEIRMLANMSSPMRRLRPCRWAVRLMTFWSMLWMHGVHGRGRYGDDVLR